MKPWNTGNNVSPELAREMIESECPGFGPVRSIELFGEGWDNTAYLVNGTHIVRFPRRELARRLMQNELTVLPLIAGKLPLPTPQLDLLGNGFAGYAMLKGQTACRARLTIEERCKLAEPLGRFLKALHSLGANVPGDELGRVDPNKRIPQIVKNLHDIDALGLLESTESIRKWLEGFQVHLVPGTKPRHVLCHGDLYARHLLVNGQHELCGVIDWGDVHMGDPAVDLSIVYGFLPPEARANFWAVYGTIDFSTVRLAELRALFSLTTLLVYGHDIGDADLVWEARQSLAWFLKAPKTVSAYNPAWPRLYEEEAEKLRILWRNDLLGIHHFGSTAVTGLRAKPIIDIMLVVPNIAVCEHYNRAMAELGYEAKGAYVHAKHRVFVKARDFHVHVFEECDPEIEANLRFRDRLISDPSLAAEYGALKATLAEEHSYSSASYRVGKDPFVKRHKDGTL